MSKLKADKDLMIFRQMLADLENELTVDQLAKKYHFSRQYINRLFLRNLGKSPSEYKKNTSF
jgi:transcriptional regulator GlxA family with amidase domain